jgi:hypothetical protein
MCVAVAGLRYLSMAVVLSPSALSTAWWMAWRNRGGGWGCVGDVVVFLSRHLLTLGMDDSATR